MRIAVLGTGMVGRALAGRLAEVGHDVVVGTRDPAATLARTGVDAMGNGPYAGWQAEHTQIELVPLAEAGATAEVLVNATAGTASVEVLTAAGVAGRPGLVVMDVANALSFATSPPSLEVANTDSLGEQIQRAFPEARVVKTLHTMTADVMVHPELVPGRHVVFTAGDDAEARLVVAGILHEFGWPEDAVVELGGITAARGTEMLMPLWLNLMGVLGTAHFNYAILRA